MLAVLIEFAMFGASLYCGWHSYWAWLAVPPIMLAVLVWRMRQKLKAAMLQSFGRDTIRNPIAQEVLLRSEIAVVTRGFTINAVLFGLAWGAQQIF